jgi:hypothetical protein
MFVGALVGEPVGDAPARETHRGGGEVPKAVQLNNPQRTAASSATDD